MTCAETENPVPDVPVEKAEDAPAEEPPADGDDKGTGTEDDKD